jgi:hypothetical protein
MIFNSLYDEDAGIVHENIESSVPLGDLADCCLGSVGVISELIAGLPERIRVDRPWPRGLDGVVRAVRGSGLPARSIQGFAEPRR